MGCASGKEVLERNPLLFEILRVRPDYPGMLTNSNCIRYEKNVCKSLEIKVYDLSDAHFRETLNAAKFLCNIGGSQFKVCLDKPGYCKKEFKQTCFLGICGKRILDKETFYPASDHAFLVNLDVRCMQNDSAFEDL